MHTYVNLCLAALQLELEMFQTKAETHILHSTIFLPKNSNAYDIMWENMVEPDRPQMVQESCNLHVR
jgi:hypothetical protein